MTVRKKYSIRAGIILLPGFSNIGRRLAGAALSMFIFQSLIAQQQKITIGLDAGVRYQQIDNIGASGCWYSEGIGKSWPLEKREAIARLLFSKKFDTTGKPEGIGLSAWRFNIGGGTAEQGEKSGIKTAVKRVECFLNPDGSYDWSKQSGYQWFLRAAKSYGVETLIAFSNTPPVQFTRNGLGFKTEKDYTCNLRPDKYDAYAAFLTTVLAHFKSEGIHFRFVSPVNEPQWDWSNKFGEMNQEGTPWSNRNIYHATAALDKAIISQKLATKILLPEAATLRHLYAEKGKSARQIQNLYGNDSGMQLTRFRSVHPVVVGHSYFTDQGDSSRVMIRRHLKDTASKYKIPFWQSEYCMLGNGYKEGKRGKIPAIDCALFLAKMIHTDLAVANAAAWQLWNVYEPGDPLFDTRYYVIALKTNALNFDGDFSVTKNLWALGHYSLFIRPGMTRIGINRSDSLNDISASGDLMVSAYSDLKKRTVIVLINYAEQRKQIDLSLKGGVKGSRIISYTTTADPDSNMIPMRHSTPDQLEIAPRSICTVIIDR